MTRLLRRLLLAAMIFASLGLIGGFLGSLHPLFDTLSNFRLHLSVLLALLAAAWTFRCSRLPALLFALLAFAGAAASAPGLPLEDIYAQRNEGRRSYQLFSMNLLWNHPNPNRVLALIERLDPDFLFLTEVSANWSQILARLRRSYPHGFHCAEWRTIGGSVILSRIPLLSDRDFCGDYASLGLTHTTISGQEIALGVVHLRWPWPASGPRQIRELEPVLARIGPNALLAGDYNSASWSHSTGRFHRAGELELVRGIGPSWGPTLEMNGMRLRWPAFIGLPIDNAATKGAVRVHSARTLADAGSDHLPVLIEFSIDE